MNSAGDISVKSIDKTLMTTTGGPLTAKNQVKPGILSIKNFKRNMKNH